MSADLTFSSRATPSVPHAVFKMALLIPAGGDDAWEKEGSSKTPYLFGAQSSVRFSRAVSSRTVSFVSVEIVTGSA
jgi:hypothetical protein